MLTHLQNLLFNPWSYAVHSIFVGYSVVTCLVAIWAGVSSVHWFWRYLAALTPIMLLVPISAWQPAWLFAFSSPMIIGVVSLNKRQWRHDRGLSTAGQANRRHLRFRFTLRDLLLTILLVGLMLPSLIVTVRHFVPAIWIGWLVSSASVALLTIATVFVVVGNRRWLWAVLLVGTLIASAALNSLAGDWSRLWTPLGMYGGFAENATTLLIVELEFVLAQVVCLIPIRAARCSTASPPARWVWTGALTVLGVGTVIWLGWFYFQLLDKPPRVAKLEAKVNHYPRILEIAGRVNAINPSSAAITDLQLSIPKSNVPNELQDLYAELLTILDAENSVPYDPEVHANEAYVQATVSNVQQFRGLARSLQAESESARNGSKAGLAAKYAFACMRLSEMLGHGGIAVDALVGRALEGVSYAQLAKLAEQMSSDEIRESRVALERAIGHREHREVLRAREADFSERAFGLAAGFEHTFAQLSGNKIPWEAALDEATKRHAMVNALLRAKLAAVQFEKENSRHPRDLIELVPNYLSDAPLDPYSGKPLCCKLVGSKFTAYSVGRDGRDDGGHFGNTNTYWSSAAGYDFDLETMTRP